MYAALKQRVNDWIFQPREPESGVVVLVQRRVFILPTRYGIAYAITLLLMLVGSINYDLSLGYILTFLLVGLGINAMLHTFRNLAHLQVSPGRVAPIHAGEDARFTLKLRNPGARNRFEIGLTRDRRAVEFHDVAAHCDAVATVLVPASHRGLLRPGRVTLFTFYPLGLFRAWSYLNLDAQCIVYPRLAVRGTPLPQAEHSGGTGALYGRGQEDFSGLRPYHPGDSPRHIAWKAAARGQGLLTKQFTGRADAELWLDWRQFPAAMDVEQKLSQLARWVVDAQASGISFGLRLPGTTVPVAAGEAQRERCLTALALYNHGDERRSQSA